MSAAIIQGLALVVVTLGWVAAGKNPSVFIAAIPVVFMLGSVLDVLKEIRDELRATAKDDSIEPPSP